MECILHNSHNLGSDTQLIVVRGKKRESKRFLPILHMPRLDPLYSSAFPHIIIYDMLRYLLQPSQEQVLLNNIRLYGLILLRFEIER